MITASELTPLFDEAFTSFLYRERDNILTGVAEQSLCSRLGIELERLCEARGLKGYVVDTEYNRNDGQVKTIIDEQMHVVKIRCDIILHSRGRIPKQDNLLAIEVKRSNHSAAEKEKDRKRLRALTKASFDDIWSADGHTLPEHVCGYVLGYYLELDVTAKTVLIELYKGGCLAESREAQF